MAETASVNRPGQVTVASLSERPSSFSTSTSTPRRQSSSSRAVLSGVGSVDRVARLARDVRHRVPCAADRIGALRAFRRPRRTQGHARRRAPHDGHVDGRHRRAADVRVHRHRRARCCSHCAASVRASASAANGAAPSSSRSKTHRPDKRAWYGMFPQLGAPLGFLLLGERLPRAVGVADRRAVPHLRLANPVSGERGARRGRTLRSADDYARRPCSAGGHQAGAREGADGRRPSRRTRARWSLGTFAVARDVRALLPHDRLLAVMGHERARIQPRTRSSSFS